MPSCSGVEAPPASPATDTNARTEHMARAAIARHSSDFGSRELATYCMLFEWGRNACITLGTPCGSSLNAKMSRLLVRLQNLQKIEKACFVQLRVHINNLKAVESDSRERRYI